MLSNGKMWFEVNLNLRSISIDMTGPIENPRHGKIHLLVVDDSEVFHLMVKRDLINKGFEQTSETILTRGNVFIHVVNKYADAMAMLCRDSQFHIDFSAIFLDWHLSKADRSAGFDGTQLAAIALDSQNQPLSPIIYCLSADADEMVYAIKEKAKMDSASLAKRVMVIDFLRIASKILELASPPFCPCQ